MNCRALQEDLWSSWPRAEVGPEAEAHARSCAECARELDSFRALCARSSTKGGEPLSWDKSLPGDGRWARLAASTRKRLLEPARRSAPVWAPALAAAAAGLALFLIARPVPKPATDVPMAAAEQLEFFEHLDLFENWDAVRAMPGGAP
ncbi:MAG TPA: hypothetical protein VNI01_03120 [Elusimicrobiota bacterium]|jgi:hypothetical protein|nr:hypothetical protein [Elusimicrobiota bacterium]